MEGYERVTKDNIKIGMEVFTLPEFPPLNEPYIVVHISPNNGEFCTMNAKQQYLVFFYEDKVFFKSERFDELAKKLAPET